MSAVERARHDPGDFVRLAAVRLLHRLSGEYPDAARALHEIAETDPKIFRYAAVEWDEPEEQAQELTDPQSLRATAVGNAHSEVRVAAVRRLPDADPGAGALLRELARAEDDWPVRDAALAVLAARYHDPETLALLHEIVADEDHQHPYARRAAAALLAGHWPEHPATGPALRGLATNDPDKDVRRAAFDAAADRLDDPATQPWLVDRLRHDTRHDARSKAVRALARDWADRPELRELFFAATEDCNGYVRAAAAQALARHHAADERTGPLLRRLVADDPDSWTRRDAAVALVTGWRADPETLATLTDRVVREPDRPLRLGLLDMLATGWRQVASVEELLRGMAVDRNSDPYVRRHLLRSLPTGCRDNRNPPDWLVGSMHADAEPDPYARKAALVALATGWRYHPRTRSLLHDRATGDPNATVRSYAAKALAVGWPEHAETAPVLHQLARHDLDASVRFASLQALLLTHPDDRATAEVLRELADADPAEQLRETVRPLLVHLSTDQG